MTRWAERGERSEWGVRPIIALVPIHYSAWLRSASLWVQAAASGCGRDYAPCRGVTSMLHVELSEL